MHWARFLFWNAAGGICWATLVGLVSYYGGKSAADAIQKYGIYAAGVLALLLVLGFLGSHYGKRWLERRL
jgi:membrane protein DedA with SNARE-associated domain